MPGEKKSKRIIIANWKMNPTTLFEASKLFQAIKKTTLKATRVQTIVCAPYLFLPTLAGFQSGQRISVGAQDSFYERVGAYTGEVSATQLAGEDIRYVILGHSERRAMGESNDLVGRKVAAALGEGLNVILCVGEKDRDQGGDYLSEVSAQIHASLASIPRRYFLNLIMVYEPVWAISTHANAVESPEDMLHMSIFIRKTLGGICGKDIAIKIPILYGGSVDEENVAGFIERGGADGALVGRASLSATSFSEIIKRANEVKID
ncbi:MAG TPA: triose-phosphate isomerase [Candidatus Paceibacterota bacterium]